MTLRGPVWEWVAVGLSVLNFAGAGYAIATAEPGHAAIHVALAVGFGLWAQRLRRVTADAESVAADLPAEIGELSAELDALRREVAELSERMDFAERVLAKERNAERIPPRT